jgi:hypothetical protein
LLAVLRMKGVEPAAAVVFFLRDARELDPAAA